jgi:hypothetical protein
MAQAAAADYAATYASTAAIPARRGGYAYPEPREIPDAQARPGARTRESERRAYGISPFSAVGFVIVAVLMILVVLAYVSMNTESKTTVDLKVRLDELAEDERKLIIAYENAFDMAQLEAYAVNVLGMMPASEGQTGTISLAPEDKAVIFSETEPQKSGVLDEMGAFILSLLEYFK